MVTNAARRERLLDAAVDCLGEDGGRGLTFRGVDRRADVPTGTTSNYFTSRPALVLATAQHVFAKLAPDPDQVRILQTINVRDIAQRREYVRAAVQRLLDHPTATLALFELRLAAARDPELRAVLQPFLLRGLGDEARFHVERCLPGDEQTASLLQHAIDGLVLDYLTGPKHPELDVLAVADVLTRRLSDESA